MADVVVAVPTGKRSVAELRGPLEKALDRELPSGLFQRRWEGEVLHVWATGASGTIALEDGHLVARARLGPPASLLRTLVEQRMTAALQAVS